MKTNLNKWFTQFHFSGKYIIQTCLKSKEMDLRMILTTGQKIFQVIIGVTFNKYFSLLMSRRVQKTQSSTAAFLTKNVPTYFPFFHQLDFNFLAKQQVKRSIVMWSLSYAQ